MKKTYMTPAVDVIRIETQQMIAVSGPNVGGTTSNESDLLSRDDEFDWDE